MFSENTRRLLYQWDLERALNMVEPNFRIPESYSSVWLKTWGPKRKKESCDLWGNRHPYTQTPVWPPRSQLWRVIWNGPALLLWENASMEAGLSYTLLAFTSLVCVEFLWALQAGVPLSPRSHHHIHKIQTGIIKNKNPISTDCLS